MNFPMLWVLLVLTLGDHPQVVGPIGVYDTKAACENDRDLVAGAPNNTERCEPYQRYN